MDYSVVVEWCDIEQDEDVFPPKFESFFEHASMPSECV